MTARPFNEDWRRRKCAAFDLQLNSTAGRTVPVALWGTSRSIYANANLSIYSGQTCNGRCGFCVEELRPASRGTALSLQKAVEADDARYFGALDEVLQTLRPLDPTVSVTGGEPTKDPRLPRILRTIAAHSARKRTLTTNGTGLLDNIEERTVIDWICSTGVRHLNISRAHVDDDRNAKLMGLTGGLSVNDLRKVVRRANQGQTRLRLSCVLLSGAIDDIDRAIEYLEFANRLGIDNVVFRQLMMADATTVEPNSVVRYGDERRVALDPLLARISSDERFVFQRQIVGYYYYVEVWRYGELDIVFEEADLAQLETTKRMAPGIIHELVFHPHARLASTWQPWDGVLGPGGESSGAVAVSAM